MSTAQLRSQPFSLPEQQIAEITDRLGRRYSREQISLVDLETRVRRFYNGFDTVHVRTYVAILVERLTRRSIDEPESLGSIAALFLRSSGSDPGQ